MSKGDKKPVVMTEDIDQSVAKKLHAAQHAANSSDPITPAMIGAVAHGGEITPEIARDSNYPQAYCGYLMPDTALAIGLPQTFYNVQYFPYDRLTGYGTQIVWPIQYSANKPRYRVSDGELWLDWKEVATTDYALNKAGDTMTGSLYFKSYDNGIGRVGKSHSDTADYGTVLCDTDKDGNFISLSLRAINDALSFTNKAANTFPILHTGNKPSGSYTGNGDATARTIDTGGIGRTLMVYCNSGFAIVTPLGAIVATAGTITHLGSGEATFYEGTLTLKTQNLILNGSGATYTYQVL